jgi:hypothetical protein
LPQRRASNHSLRHRHIAHGPCAGSVYVTCATPRDATTSRCIVHVPRCTTPRCCVTLPRHVATSRCVCIVHNATLRCYAPQAVAVSKTGGYCDGGVVLSMPVST